ncbi:uncharacterized protein LOC144875515 [Branchiostoma floridae x Branchiostoma japonicum]
MKTLLVAILVTTVMISSSESRAVSGVLLERFDSGALLERFDSEIKEQRHLASKRNGQDVVIDPGDDWYSPMMGKRISFDSYEEGHDLRPMEVDASGHKESSEVKVDEGSDQS